jgi:thioredoxin reductase (NADPH)
VEKHIKNSQFLEIDFFSISWNYQRSNNIPMQKFSCIIIGAGPAGLQAALFLGRASVSTLVIGMPEKSDLAYGKIIGNYFGLGDDTPGITLLLNGVEQIKKYGVTVLKENVLDAQKLEDGLFHIITESKKEYRADALIITAGQAHTKAGIQGETKFLGIGVHTCVACDGILYKDKKVGVLGSGSHAAYEAIELTTYTNYVTLFTQGEPPQWSPELLNQAQKKGVTISEKRIKKIRGGKHMEAVEYWDNTEQYLDGIFIALGSASSLTFAYKLGLEQKDGFLVIDRDGKTNVENIWAAGGSTGGNPQIAKDVGEGCNAAINVIKKVKGMTQYLDQT